MQVSRRCGGLTSAADTEDAPAPPARRSLRPAPPSATPPTTTEFTATLVRVPGTGGWTIATIPDRCAPPVQHAWGRTPVVATVDGHRGWTSVWRERSGRTLQPVPEAARGDRGHGDREAVRPGFSL